ncbi:proline-rich protein HaeIII subfamily 1-like [Cervus elaphus]|uniref:proline-rich protein HaeIII subfamily 1-like n=1 Tax=Cervus elaphus TaxID=9860 RepID=UPI001CC2C679|nr:proline-rich protein HaeIII subfamily 1-like [Cervus elaphus]
MKNLNLQSAGLKYGRPRLPTAIGGPLRKPRSHLRAQQEDLWKGPSLWEITQTPTEPQAAGQLGPPSSPVNRPGPQGTRQPGTPEGPVEQPGCLRRCPRSCPPQGDERAQRLHSQRRLLGAAAPGGLGFSPESLDRPSGGRHGRSCPRLSLSPPPGPPGARSASTEPVAPHTRQSRVPGLRPPRQLPPLWTPVPAPGPGVTVGQGQSAAGPGQAEGPAAPPEVGEPVRTPRGAGKGGGSGRNSRAARGAATPPAPSPPQRTPRRSRTFLRGARSDFQFPAPRNPLRRARRGVRASRRASRVRAPRHPASPPLDLDPRPHRDPDPDVRTHQRSPRARNCLPASRRGCRRPAPEPA